MLTKIFGLQYKDPKLECIEHMEALDRLIAKVHKKIAKTRGMRRQYWMERWEELILTHMECEWRMRQWHRGQE